MQLRGLESARPDRSKQQAASKRQAEVCHFSFTTLYRELIQVEKARGTNRIRGSAPRQFVEVTAGRTQVSMFFTSTSAGSNSTAPSFKREGMHHMIGIIRNIILHITFDEITCQQI